MTTDGLWLLLNRRVFRLRAQAQLRADELLDILLDQLAADNPSLLRQDIALLVELGGDQENVVGRSPFACVASQLTVAVMRRLVAVGARI